MSGSFSRALWILFRSMPCVTGKYCLTYFLLFSSALLSAQLPEGFIREKVAGELNPTSIVLSPDGRVFITEKNGLIRIIRDDQLLETPLLTLEVDDSNERGLGHMVLHPDFEQNGYYYVFYSVPGLRFNRVSRFTANGDHTIPGSELVILDLDELGSDIHNGGDMVFGFDGYLYIGTGDGGQNWRGEDLGSTNGKILRVDEFGSPVPDNAWFNLNYLRANFVYAYGFRNPYTLTIHPLTGEIFANDVGFSAYEEVNKVESGRFYGWPKVEGKRTNQVVPQEYQDPVFQYAHTNNYCAIVGSVFYLPEVQQFPEQYAGRYFYSDYCTGHIRMLDTETGLDRGLFISDGDRVIDLDVAADGSLYYLERKGLGDGSPDDNTGTNDGALWKVSYTGSGAPFISLQPQDVLSAIGEDATFSVLASGAAPLEYTWLVNGEDVITAEGPSLVLQNVLLDQDSTTIQVEVRNGFGQQYSAEALLRVTDNHRPEPMITAPVDGSMYHAGSTIAFSGFATDHEDGSLAESGLSWKIDFHHGTHVHPGLSWTNGISSGEWSIPTVGETSADVWYRIYLKASDSEGFSKVMYRDVYPELGKITVSSLPEGLNINLDGASRMTPFEVEGVRGLSRFITPPYKQVRGDSIYFFDRWSDGETRIDREIMASGTDQSFVGLFDGMPNGKGHGLTVSYFDNPQFAGSPVAVAVDSILDHQYLLNAPFPGVPEDNFGVVWKGYLQPYKTGTYTFTVFSDDGVFVSIDGNAIIQNWEPGVHYETGKIFLETGQVYPVHIRLYDLLYGSQLRFRWSSDDFPEEVVPSSQLYPADFLSSDTISELIAIQVISAQEVLILTESYKEVYIDFTVIATDGKSYDYPDVLVPIGKNTLPLDVSHLAAGMYYLRGYNKESGDTVTTPFVKVQ
jgi:glucose/arabinose dehydrogenase